VDVDAFVAVHEPEWRRLQQLLRRRRSLTGAEVDELVELYRRTATHLSVVQTRSPDPVLISRLSTLVAQARSAVTGTNAVAWRDLGRFFSVTFPTAVYRAWPWWSAVGVAFTLVAFAIGGWVAANPDVQAQLLPPEQVRSLVENDFEDYYSSNPAGSFAAQVWTNNALIAAATLVLGVLVLPALYILAQNAVSIGVVGGFMAGAGKADVLFGLLLPHGLLELTAVFVAAGAGLRLGWSWIDPGPRLRGQALAEETRAAVLIALGLVVVLAVSGVIEAFVTPSGLPTWARVGIGVLAEVAFLTYVVVLGRRGVAAGITGDLERGAGAADLAPVA